MHDLDYLPMNDIGTSEVLPLADVSYGIVLLPGVGFRREIAAASAAITAEMPNENVINEAQFPAHVSMFLGGTTRTGIESLAAALADLARVAPRQLDATKLAPGSRGFLAAEVRRTPELVALAEAIVGRCGALHRLAPVYRPHLVRRWVALTQERRSLLREFGTYKTAEAWNPHISIASVSEASLPRAVSLAAAALALPQTVRVEAVQLVDVGHENERWNVLSSCPLH